MATWLLGFGLTLFLALEGGGYDSVIRDQVGIVVWWIAVVGLLAGALPVRKPGMLSLAGIALLAGFALWTATSLIWTESVERTTNDLARVLTYLGIFVLAVMIRGPRGARQMATAVGSCIALVSLIALVSRLQPSLIPEATEAAEILGGGRGRLAYPLNYWNGLAELMAIGLPLMLFVATSTRSRALRAVAGGLIPAVGLALFLDFLEDRLDCGACGARRIRCLQRRPSSEGGWPSCSRLRAPAFSSPLRQARKLWRLDTPVLSPPSRAMSFSSWSS